MIVVFDEQYCKLFEVCKSSLGNLTLLFKIAAVLFTVAFNISCATSTESSDTQIKYVYSILETTDSTGSKYNIISNSGAQIQEELSSKSYKGWFVALQAQSTLENYEADGIKFSGEDITPINYSLNAGVQFKESVSVYLSAGHLELPLAKTLTTTTSSLNKLSFETAGLGLTIAAETRMAFSTIIDLHIITAYKSSMMGGTEAEFSSRLGGSNRFDFKSRKGHYGIICGFETSTYGVSGVSTARLSQANGGFYYNFDF
ncbi:MAG: hypothetical protein ABL927_00960 [Bdellovibrionales bacterium]